MEILLDAHNLNRTAENLNISHVSVQDILKELNARLSTVRLASTKQKKLVLYLLQVECVLYGHVTMDGTFVVISVPTKSPDSAMMVRDHCYPYDLNSLFIHGVNSIVGAF